jgi:multiple sugar transport system substrate-binding protein
MKKISALLLTAMTLALTTGCTDSDIVTIDFWHNYSAGDGQVEVLEDLIAEFEEDHPNIHVEHVFLEWSALRQGVILGADTGLLPDLLRGDIAFVPQFQSLNVLEELSAYDDYETVADTVLAQPNSSNLMNGKYYGLASNTNTKILFYNEDILEAADVDVPTTLDEMWDAASAVSSETVIGYVEPWTGIWNVGPYIWSEGGDILSPDNTTATGYLNGAIPVAVISKMRQMYADGHLTGSSMNPSAMGDTDGWAAGKYAMELDGPWRQASNNAAGINYGAIPLPPGDEGSISVLGGENFMMFKTSPDEEKAAAWEFTKFLAGEHAQVEMAKHGQMPVNKDALENAEAVTAMPLLPVFAEALETARARPVIPEWGDIENIIAASVAEAITGAKAVQTALDEAVTAINAILAG